MKHDHERVVEWFLNSKKAHEVWKLWDLLRSHDIIRGGYGKKIEKVSHNMSCTMFTNRSISEEES